MQTHIRACLNGAGNLGAAISRGVAQPGSASGLGPEGRKFESCLPDQFFNDLDDFSRWFRLKYRPQKAGTERDCHLASRNSPGAISGLCSPTDTNHPRNFDAAQRLRLQFLWRSSPGHGCTLRYNCAPPGQRKTAGRAATLTSGPHDTFAAYHFQFYGSHDVLASANCAAGAA